jgi:hypothetical protein
MKHHCKICGKHLGKLESVKVLPFKCLGKEEEGKWLCDFPFKGSSK